MNKKSGFPKLKFVKGIAIATALVFLSTSIVGPYPMPVAHAAPAVDIRSSWSVPREWGEIQSQFQGDRSEQRVVLIQDAHAVSDAQENIQRLLNYFQQTYGVRLFALEGGKSKLDPTLMRAFPDAIIKKQVLSSYMKRAELSGSEMAAIFNERAGDFEGVEKWDLYEENYRAYRQATAQRAALLKMWESLKDQLDAEQKDIFSKELHDLYISWNNFREERITLLDLLIHLSNFKSLLEDPSEFPELKKLVASIGYVRSGRQAALDPAIKEMAAEFKAKYVRGMGVKDEMNFYAAYQSFLTGKMESGEFLRYLIDLGAKRGFRPKLTPQMKMLLGHTELLSAIKGGRLFDELQRFLPAAAATLAKSKKEKDLSLRYQKIFLLKDLIKLELTQSQIEEYRRSPDEYLNLFTAPDFRKKIYPALAFYKLALERDEAIFRNLIALMERRKQNALVLVAGGFHTQGIERRLHDQGISYLVVTPKMRSMAGYEHYAKVMQGDLSYKEYLTGTYYDAFIRHASQKLVSELNEADFRRDLKLWRDAIIRQLAAEGRIADSGKYTIYIDALYKIYQDRFGKNQTQRSKEEILKAVQTELERFRDKSLERIWERFESQLKTFMGGLQDLIVQKKLNLENITTLLDRTGQPGVSLLAPNLGALTPDMAPISNVPLIDTEPVEDLLGTRSDIQGALLRTATGAVPADPEAGLQTLAEKLFKQGIKSEAMLPEVRSVGPDQAAVQLKPVLEDAAAKLNLPVPEVASRLYTLMEKMNQENSAQGLLGTTSEIQTSAIDGVQATFGKISAQPAIPAASNLSDDGGAKERPESKTVQQIEQNTSRIPKRGFLARMGMTILLAGTLALGALWPVSVYAKDRVAQSGILYAKDGWLVKGGQDTGPSASEIDFGKDGAYSEIKVSRQESGLNFYQVASVKGNGFLRATLPPDTGNLEKSGDMKTYDWGTSWVLPGYWDHQGNYHHNMRITKGRFEKGPRGGFVLKGKLSDDTGILISEDFEIYFKPYEKDANGHTDKFDMEVSFTLKVAQKPGSDALRLSTAPDRVWQRFRLVQWSSMYVDEITHDADTVGIKNDKGGWDLTALGKKGELLFDKAVSLPQGQIVLGNRMATRNVPDAHVIMVEPNATVAPMSAQFYNSGSLNADDDSVGGWLQPQGIRDWYMQGLTVGKYRFILRVTPPGSFAQPDQTRPESRAAERRVLNIADKLHNEVFSDPKFILAVAKQVWGTTKDDWVRFELGTRLGILWRDFVEKSPQERRQMFLELIGLQNLAHQVREDISGAVSYVYERTKEGDEKTTLEMNSKFISGLQDDELAFIYGHELGHAIIRALVEEPEDIQKISSKIRDYIAQSDPKDPNLKPVPLTDAEKVVLQEYSQRNEHLADQIGAVVLEALYPEVQEDKKLLARVIKSTLEKGLRFPVAQRSPTRIFPSDVLPKDVARHPHEVWRIWTTAGKEYYDIDVTGLFFPDRLVPLAGAASFVSLKFRPESRNTEYRFIEGSDREALIRELIAKDRSEIEQYFERWGLAMLVAQATYPGITRLDPRTMAKALTEDFFSSKHPLYRQRFIQDGRSGEVWLLKRFEPAQGKRASRNDPKAEMLVHKLMGGKDTTEIRFLAPEETSRLGIAPEEASQYFLSKIVRDQTDKVQLSPSEQKEALSKTFSRILVADIWLRKIDHMFNNFSFDNYVPVSIDHAEALDYREIPADGKGFNKFLWTFLMHSVFRPGFGLIDSVDSRLARKAGDQLRGIEEFTAGGGYDFALGLTIETSRQFGLLQGMLKAEMLEASAIRSAIQEFKGISAEMIRDYAQASGYEGAELEAVTAYILKNRDSLGRDMSQVWTILNHQDESINTVSDLLNFSDGEFSDLDLAPAERPEARMWGQVETEELLSPRSLEDVAENLLKMGFNAQDARNRGQWYLENFKRDPELAAPHDAREDQVQKMLRDKGLYFNTGIVELREARIRAAGELFLRAADVMDAQQSQEIEKMLQSISMSSEEAVEPELAGVGERPEARKKKSPDAEASLGAKLELLIQNSSGGLVTDPASWKFPRYWKGEAAYAEKVSKMDDAGFGNELKRIFAPADGKFVIPIDDRTLLEYDGKEFLREFFIHFNQFENLSHYLSHVKPIGFAQVGFNNDTLYFERLGQYGVLIRELMVNRANRLEQQLKSRPEAKTFAAPLVRLTGVTAGEIGSWLGARGVANLEKVQEELIQRGRTGLGNMETLLNGQTRQLLGEMQQMQTNEAILGYTTTVLPQRLQELFSDFGNTDALAASIAEAIVAPSVEMEGTEFVDVLQRLDYGKLEQDQSVLNRAVADLLQNAKSPQLSLIMSHPGQQDAAVVLEAIQQLNLARLIVFHKKKQPLGQAWNKKGQLMGVAIDGKDPKILAQRIVKMKDREVMVAFWPEDLGVSDLDVYSMRAEVRKISNAKLKQFILTAVLYAFLKFSSLSDEEQAKIIAQPGLIKNYLEPYGVVNRIEIGKDGQLFFDVEKIAQDYFASVSISQAA